MVIGSGECQRHTSVGTPSSTSGYPMRYVRVCANKSSPINAQGRFFNRSAAAGDRQVKRRAINSKGAYDDFVSEALTREREKRRARGECCLHFFFAEEAGGRTRLHSQGSWQGWESAWWQRRGRRWAWRSRGRIGRQVTAGHHSRRTRREGRSLRRHARCFYLSAML